MTAIKQGGADAVRDYLNQARDGLAKAMAYTGCADPDHMNSTVIRRV